MANLFCCDTGLQAVSPTSAVAASVLEHRRYGYQFGDAVTGPDGELIFGENDNGGHLWLYFPKIKARPQHILTTLTDRHWLPAGKRMRAGPDTRKWCCGRKRTRCRAPSLPRVIRRLRVH